MQKIKEFKEIKNNSLTWLKKNMFNTPINSAISFIVLYIIFKVLEFLFSYFVANAVFVRDAARCRAIGGFCYPFLKEKSRFILFGFYPQEAIWRPLLGMLQLVLILNFFKDPKKFKFHYLGYIFISFIVYFFLLRGGWFLSHVTNDKWGGLPLTILLSFVGISVAYPLGIGLALARRSKLVILKKMSTIYIELMRGVPLISVLFMSSVLFPLFMPDDVNFDKLLRAQIAIIMFVSAYMAEVVRGGLAAIDQGQYEASHSLGLSYFQSMFYIIIPQALRVVIPPSVNTAIGMFKDTSLVLIISLFDLLNTAKSSVRDPQWLGFSIEAYVFIGIIYYIFCSQLSKYSRRLEIELKN